MVTTNHREERHPNKQAFELYREVAKKSGIGMETVKTIIPLFLQEILETIKNGEDVNMKGFGRFLVVHHSGYWKEIIGGWDKETNKPIRKKMYCRPKYRVRFRPMKYFTETVAELNITKFGDEAFNTKERHRWGQRRY